MLKLVISLMLLVGLGSAAQAEKYSEVYRCEITNYGRSTGFGGNAKEKAEMLESWMTPVVFYVAALDDTAFIHFYKGERIEASRIVYSEARLNFEYQDFPKSNTNRTFVREFKLSILLSNLSFTVDMKLRKPKYRHGGGEASGVCEIQKNRTLS